MLVVVSKVGLFSSSEPYVSPVPAALMKPTSSFPPLSRMVILCPVQSDSSTPLKSTKALPVSIDNLMLALDTEPVAGAMLGLTDGLRLGLNERESDGDIDALGDSLGDILRLIDGEIDGLILGLRLGE
jgi:hypothetical protein